MGSFNTKPHKPRGSLTYPLESNQTKDIIKQNYEEALYDMIFKKLPNKSKKIQNAIKNGLTFIYLYDYDQEILHNNKIYTVYNQYMKTCRDPANFKYRYTQPHCLSDYIHELEQIHTIIINKLKPFIKTYYGKNFYITIDTISGPTTPPIVFLCWEKNHHKEPPNLYQTLDPDLDLYQTQDPDLYQNLDIICCVCLEETPRKTKCNHHLCKNCDNSIMKRQCPLCQRQLPNIASKINKKRIKRIKWRKIKNNYQIIT